VVLTTRPRKRERGGPKKSESDDPARKAANTRRGKAWPCNRTNLSGRRSPIRGVMGVRYAGGRRSKKNQAVGRETNKLREKKRIGTPEEDEERRLYKD